jgi:hypothetical protein
MFETEKLSGIEEKPWQGKGNMTLRRETPGLDKGTF